MIRDNSNYMAGDTWRKHAWMDLANLLRVEMEVQNEATEELKKALQIYFGTDDLEKVKEDLDYGLVHMEDPSTGVLKFFWRKADNTGLEELVTITPMGDVVQVHNHMVKRSKDT